MRLMAGAGLVTEGFQEGQVGSSAMPHKVNARNCERICGFSTILGGYVTMTGALAGDQWNEGDVSCSVVRRVALPDAFFAIDGCSRRSSPCSTRWRFPVGDRAENERNLPFLATTTILMEAVKHGAGRETAHEAIKEHSLAAAKAMRAGERPGRTCSTGWPATGGSASARRRSRRSWPRARVSWGRRRTRWTPSWRR
jgi:adenylosuccinate lyase